MFQEIQQFFEDIWANSTARWVLLLTILVLMILVAVYLAQKFRQLAVGGGAADLSENLTDFREMKEKGLLDEHEFKRVRTVITPPAGEGGEDRGEDQGAAKDEAPSPT